MGFAQSGITVDQKGVVILGGMLCNGHRSGVSELVGGADYKGLEGKFGGCEPVRLPLGRSAALKFNQAVVVEDFDLEIHGENVMERVFDVAEKEGFNVSLFEVVGTVEKAGVSPDIDNRQFVEPGGDGGFGESPPKLPEDVFPDIGYGIQAEAPLSL